MFQCVVIIVFFAAFCLEKGQTNTITVSTKSGQVRGQLVKLSPGLEVYEFAGIPFAEPPVGERRFRKPSPKQAWPGVLDTLENPKGCPQMIPDAKDYPSLFQLMLATTNVSEDCLYLNIWIPKDALDAAVSNNGKTKKLSLFTFIHGGGYSSGAVSLTTYNGSVLAAHNNIIVATIQYRLGSLGFGYLGTEEMPGNMGLWDQLEAMKWLCENIDSFGGDCSSHTIFGESAGSMSVTHHLLSPYSRRYFSRAIAQSGTAQAGFAHRKPEKILEDTNKVYLALKNENCSSTDETASTADKIKCLMSLPSESFPLADAMLGLNAAFFPVIDGDFVPRNPREMLQDEDFYKAPLMAGFNKNEGSIFIALNPKTAEVMARINELNYTDYSFLVDAMFGETSSSDDGPDPLALETIKMSYWTRCSRQPYPKGQIAFNAVEAAIGEYLLSCPTLDWAKLASNADEMASKVYGYYFSEPLGFAGENAVLGTFHAAELFYVFGMPFFPQRKVQFSRNDKALSKIIMAYWTNFAKHGDPNVKDGDSPRFRNRPLQLRSWPPYKGENCDEQVANINSRVQHYQRGSSTICSLKARDCAFWNEFYPKLTARLAKSVESE